MLHNLAKCIPFSELSLPALSRSEDAIVGLVTNATEIIGEIELPENFH
jgi:hypothetical protein